MYGLHPGRRPPYYTAAQMTSPSLWSARLGSRTLAVATAAMAVL
jgi:hypothetical protein